MNEPSAIHAPTVPLLVRMGSWSGLVGERACRTRRIMILIAGIIALSIADLVITITHLRTIGMIEANPVASWLITTYQSAWVLAAYKLITVSVCIAALYCIRQRVIGEMAAWCSVMTLAGMAVVWHMYAQELDQPEGIHLVQHAAADEQWLFLE